MFGFWNILSASHQVAERDGLCVYVCVFVSAFMYVRFVCMCICVYVCP